MLNPNDYVANVRLTQKTDQGFKLLAEPGQSCASVPAESLDWLLADGLIQPKDGYVPPPAPPPPPAPVKPARRRKAKKE